MENNGRKSVLMTTMSILRSRTSVSYYYFQEEESAASLYCDGISSLEPGTKYFLSKYPIDEIIVVGSRETVKENDRRDVESLAEGMEGLGQSGQAEAKKGWKISEGLSAFEFYKYRISSFLQEQGEGGGMDEAAAESAGEGIDAKRRRELRELLESACPEENAFLMKPEPWKEIGDRIRESIQKGFEDSPEYEKYKEKKKQLFSYQAEYCEREQLAGNYQKFRKEIEDDKELSLFEKEYYYVYLDKMVGESIHRNIIKNMETELAELQKERDELRYQIKAIQEERQRSEFAYVKYLAYENLDKKHKLRALAGEGGFPQKRIAMRFVDEQKYGEDNVSGIVNALYGEDGKEKEMDLYIDMQGGSRTFCYVRNAILSILSNQFPEKVQIKEIVSTNYNPSHPGASEIVIENKRYQIQDLVSGMNAFIRYGKADIIQNYCKMMGKWLKTGENTAADRLVAYMVKIDDSISLCDVTALADAVKGMRDLLTQKEIEGEEGESTSFVENVFRILTDGIKKDYGRLLEDTEGNGNTDYMELISWCVRKGFIQQALTLIEDKMPEAYFEKGILNYKFEDDPKGDLAGRYAETVPPKYEKRVENKLFYHMQAQQKENLNTDDPLFEMLWHMRSPKEMEKVFEKGSDRKDFEDSREKRGGIKEYIKDTLKRKGYKEGSWKIKKERIKGIMEELSRAGNEGDFVKLYCEFRKMNKEYEELGERMERNLADPGTVYSIAKDKIDASGKVPFYSILACCGTREYAVKKSSQNAPKDALKNIPKNTSKAISENGGSTLFKITLGLHPGLEGHKEELEQLFLLHEALKQERNCCNHASEKGLRLSANLVKQAIMIYAKNLRRIYGYLEKGEATKA